MNNFQIEIRMIKNDDDVMNVNRDQSNNKVNESAYDKNMCEDLNNNNVMAWNWASSSDQYMAYTMFWKVETTKEKIEARFSVSSGAKSR